MILHDRLRRYEFGELGKLRSVPVWTLQKAHARGIRTIAELRAAIEDPGGPLFRPTRSTNENLNETELGALRRAIADWSQ